MVRPVSVRPAGITLAALAGLTYASTLGYGFVWDDAMSVQRWLPALKHWWSPFFPPADIPAFPYNYYRPLQLLSYRLDRAIGDGTPWPFHVTVVVLHVVATVLVFRTGLRLFEGYRAAWPGALWAGALFAAHPIHSESVAWMGARPDVMVTCLGLTALLAYWRTDWSDLRRSSIAAALIFVALLCKENAIALVLLVPASALVWQRRLTNDGRRPGATTALPSTTSLRTYLPFVAAAVVYVVLRWTAMPAGASGPTMPANPVQAIIGALGAYFRLLVLPYPQNAYIADVPTGGAAFVVHFLILFVYAALLWLTWRRDDRPLSFSLAWIAVTLAPSLAVINMTPTAPLAERYLYVPSIGFCWAFGAAVARACEHGRNRRLIVQVGAAVLVVVACGLTLNRNRIWRDNYSSWKDTAAKNAVEGLPMRNFAAATLDRGDMAEAQRLFRVALERRNDRRGQRLIYGNLGTIAVNLGDDVAAERYYRKALEIDVEPDSLFNLGLLLLRRAIDPKGTGDAGVRTENLVEARALLDRALAANPHDPDIYIGLAHVAEATGDLPEARRRFEQALEMGPPAATTAAVRKRMERLR